MEDLEQQALSTFHNPPSIWVRYVDDVYGVDDVSTSIFCKPTHTGRYLPFNSHHPFSQKVSIVLELCTLEQKKSLTMKVTENQN